jgi:hypothetical protein
MLQKRQVRSRRPLAVERLEDRLVLSGNVLVSQTVFTGQVIIVGDNGNNAFSINQTNNLGTPTLTVVGSPTTPPIGPPGNFTAINSVIGGSFNVPLASVSEIDVMTGNGTNFVSFGNVAGFSLPGNIKITYGTDANTFTLNNISTNAGIISISQNPPATPVSPASITVTETNIIAGASQITGGTDTTTVSQNNVTLGFDTITTPGAGNITITNSRFRPPPRTWAIGQLTINADTTVPGKSSSVTIDNINVGPSVVNIAATAAAAPSDKSNTLKYDDSTIQFATIQIGSETVGSETSNTVEINNDVMVGTDRAPGVGLNVKILNQSGVSGQLIATDPTTGKPLPGTPNPQGKGINTFTENNVQFANGGDDFTRIDDGSSQFNAGNNGFFGGMSTVLMELVDTSGRFSVTLGDHFSSVMLGVGTPGLNDIDAGLVDVVIGNDNDVIVITVLEMGDRFDRSHENITIGDVSTVFIPPLAPPSVLINGTWRDNDNGDDDVTINLGNNNNPNLGGGWPITVSETVGSNMTIQPKVGTDGKSVGGNGWNLTVVNTIVPGTLNITMGNGGPGNTEILTLNNVTAGDLNIQLNSNNTQVPDTATFGAFINLNQVNVTDPYGGLNLTDIGTGVDIASFLNVNVAEMLTVLLSGSGMNVLSAQNVTTCFGTIDGGVGPGGLIGNLYVDLGGNFGYTVTDFVGH